LDEAKGSKGSGSSLRIGGAPKKRAESKARRKVITLGNLKEIKEGKRK
jgi:hypothetical protein